MKTTGIILIFLFLSLVARTDNVTSKAPGRYLTVAKRSCLKKLFRRMEITLSVGPSCRRSRTVSRSIGRFGIPTIPDKLLTAYLPDLPDAPTNREKDYSLVNGVIDLKGKKFLELPDR